MQKLRTTRQDWFGVALFFALFLAPRVGIAESATPSDPNVSSRAVSATPSADADRAEINVYDGGFCNGSTVAIPEEIGCQPCPCAYAWAEALILGREDGVDNRPLVLDLNTNEVLLSTDDLDFNAAGGVRIGFGSRICGCWSGEFVYMGVFDQTAWADVELEDGLMLPGTLGLQVNNFFGADEVDVAYTSDLHSFESNLVHCCCCDDGCGGARSVEWLAGFRYLNLDEDFSITSYDSAESTSIYQVDADNNLYGGQLGGRYRRCSGPWSLETTAKAGVYANDMEQSQAPIVDFLDFYFRSGRGSDDTEVAFVGDLNFTVIYQFCELWGFRVGYNLIWLDGVALAANQLDFSNTPDSGTELDGDGYVFLHGVNLGLETRW